jgi:hypothetical protein
MLQATKRISKFMVESDSYPYPNLSLFSYLPAVYYKTTDPLEHSARVIPYSASSIFAHDGNTQRRKFV